MHQKVVIGLDIGTTSAKAVMFARSGASIAESEELYPTHHPHPSWSEQNPEQMEAAAISAIKQVVDKSGIPPSALQGVGISAAMHSLICIDQDTRPLSPLITWADGRSVEQAERVKKEHPDIYLQTGTPIHPMSPLSKLIWMKEHAYPAYQQAAAFVSIKEYLIHKWFGRKLVDYSIASATGMFNIHTLDWEPKALELAGVSREQLFTPVPPSEKLEGIDPAVARQMGIPAGIPFVIGASDGPLANLGIGAIHPGEVAVTIGTSGAIRQMASAPRVDELQEVFCYAFTNDLWIMGGPTNNGGIVFQWLKEVLGDHEVKQAAEEGVDAYDLLTRLAAEASPGAGGLLFLPFLNGERAPYWDANARGSFIGFNQSHQKKDLIRSVLEGVIFNIYSIGDTLERLAGAPSTLMASGGFARSPLWLQLLADVFGQNVQVPQSYQSSAWGAAWVALYAIGEVDSLESIQSSVPMQQEYVSNEAHHRTYQELYSIYRELYGSLQDSFHSLAQFQQGR